MITEDTVIINIIVDIFGLNNEILKYTTKHSMY